MIGFTMKKAQINATKNISSIWIIPIITAFVGLWIIFVNISNQGKSFTLLTSSAEGIVAGKTSIQNRNVEVGVIESVTLSDNFENVILKGRMKKGMEELLKNDSIFWIVKPQIGRQGISGLETLLSGVYIEVAPGKDAHELSRSDFTLLTQPPVASPNTPGVRINIVSQLSGVLSVGAPVLFRGISVGKIEQARFEAVTRQVYYEVFIPSPYDTLVTENARFWLESGLDIEMSPQGIHLSVPSVDALLGGGVSFDIPEGADIGGKAKNGQQYELFANKNSIQDSQYTNYKEFLVFFSDSIGGLTEGSAVEFRGIRIGTVSEAPYRIPELKNIADIDYSIPVLIRVEYGRLKKISADPEGLLNQMIVEQKNGLRAVLKSANLITGALYIDLDFYNDQIGKPIHDRLYNYPVIETTSAGLTQIQHKIMQALDNVNNLPIQPMIADVRKTLQESQKTIASLNKIVASKEMQQLPKETQMAIKSLNETLKGFQPGSTFHNGLVADINRIDEVLRELKPVLNKLNDKSNALIFEAKTKQDPKPKAKRNVQ